MANVLAWLTGREDRTADPPPVAVGQQELRNYYPSPSERFGNWISDALGAGPGASLPRQNFAKGVPSVLSLFPPLGVGLSAADVAHAKAAGDPMGAAAAAIGMVPGAGKLAPEARGLAKGGMDEASLAIKQIEEALFGPSAGGQFIPPKPVAIPGTNPAMAKGGDPNVALAAIEEVLGKQAPGVLGKQEPGASYVKFDPHVGDYTVFDKNHKPIESFPTGDKAKNFATKWDQAAIDPLGKYKQALAEGKLTQQEYDEFAKVLGQPNNIAGSNLPSKEGYTLSSAASKDFPGSEKDYFVHDPQGNKVGELIHSPEEVHDEHSSTPANWQLSMEGVAPKSGTSLEDLMGYIPGWHKQTLGKTTAAPKGLEPVDQTISWMHPEDTVFKNGQWWQKEGLPNTTKANLAQVAENKAAMAPAKPIFDYEKDDNGLYHVFDAVSGKTHTVVDKESQAKAWINEQKAAGMGMKQQTIPITEHTPAPAFEFPKPQMPQTPLGPQVPARPPWLGEVLPEAQREAARLAGNYTTPAWRGVRIPLSEDLGTVYRGDELFSSNNPKLADMYSSSLSYHPGEHPSQGAYGTGASSMPLWMNTQDYHVADAKGANWSDFNWKAIKEAKEQGKKGVVIHNVWDEPHSTKSLSSPNTVYITFPEGLSTMKSKFAGQFNPSSKDIAQSIAAMLGVPAAALPFMKQEGKAK